MPDKLAQLEALWQAVDAGGPSAPPLADLERQAHTLAGTAGTLGFRELSLAARALELLLEQAGAALIPAQRPTSCGPSPRCRPACLSPESSKDVCMPQPLTRILYVEDEPDIRTVAQMALEAVGGFTVIACASGREALAAASVADIDLLLLDVMMPGMDGPSTLQALRNLPATAQTPVIFMTAKVQAAEIAQYLALGALDVIHKPFDPMTLSEQITRIWAQQGA